MEGRKLRGRGVEGRLLFTDPLSSVSHHLNWVVWSSVLLSENFGESVRLREEITDFFNGMGGSA